MRDAIPEDLPVLAAIEAAVAAHDLHAGWSADALALGLTAHHGVRLLEQDGTVIGHIALRGVAGEGEILTVAVHPTVWRRGHGARLLHEADRWWRAQGVHTAWLEVRADNLPAQGLYAGAGWKAVGRRRAYYRDGTDALVLQKVL